MIGRRWFRNLAAPRIAAAVTAGGLVVGGLAGAAPAAAASTPVNVIVQGTSVPVVQTLVGVVGGHTITQLPLVNGVLAQVPSSNAVNLLQSLGLLTSPDAPVAVDGLAGALPSNAPAGSNAFPDETGATNLATNGITGSGVGVAVLDTGIDPLPDFGNRLRGGVDFSGEGNPLQDNYGHGTFVAGLVAGDGSSSGGAYTGEATGANVVSVKVAGASGLTDVTKVIQGIAWAINNQSTYGIRVLNMSLGEVPTGPTQLNPLDQAVEAAWRAGITVVTSAGNSGPSAGTITAPGDDPDVITVGALNDNATTGTADDSIASFSSVGPTSANAWLKPDLVAAGRSVVSLRAPGSYIDQTYPTAEVGTGNFVGSGTSFSAAVVSGAAALIAQENPSAAPDEIKARLLATATAGPTGDPATEGHGDLDAFDAANCPPVSIDQRYSSVAMPPYIGVAIPLLSTWAVSSWNPSNYSANVNSSAWNSSAWNSSAWNSSAWNSSAWNSSAWNSSAWNSSAWNSSAWNSSAWNSSAWNSSAWNSSAWN
ncbi:MAG TPA: S8 family serine peptidase [Mycobacteriales bacterium]|nr:S8 family serine peptidase [Mycobacteriales bacterium]